MLSLFLAAALTAGPAPVTLLADVVDVGAAGDHTCAVSGDGSVWCWGEGSTGSVTECARNDRSIPVKVAGLPIVGSIGVAGDHVCARGETGDVYCWGVGRLGDKNGANQIISTPTRVQMPWVSALFSVPGFAVYALDAVGNLYTIADVENFRVNSFPWAKGVAEASGRCVRWSDGRAKCWATAGEIEFSNVAEVAGTAVRESFCSRGLDGSVSCLGDRLASGPPLASERSATPKKVPGLIGVRELSLGDEHACAIRSDGQVWCWGSNERGQLGIPEGESRDSPVWATGITMARKLALGSKHSCALLTDGTVWCWGADEHGQLGRGSIVATSIERSNQAAPAVVKDSAAKP